MKKSIFGAFKIVTLFFVFAYISVSILYSQNLVSNGDFEFHKVTAPLITPCDWDNFWMVKDWKSLNFRSKYINYKIENCSENIVFPNSGSGMAKLYFGERCPWNLDTISQTELFGCAGYIQAKLLQDLVQDSFYRISIDVFIPNDKRFQDLQMDHIGFTLSSDPIQFQGKHRMISCPFFTSTDLPINKWFTLQKFIRAQCSLQYLAIGLFKSLLLPKVYSGHRTGESFYYVDNVKIEKISASTIIPSEHKVIPFCNYIFEQSNRLKLVGDKTILNFELGSSNLSSFHKLQIDSFIKNFNSVKDRYEIYGHTDQFGSNHDVLSIERANSIKDYLASQYGIKPERIFTRGLGIRFPQVSKEENAITGKNRRVEIVRSDLNSQQILYRSILEDISIGDMSLAIKKLYVWIDRDISNQSLLLLFDPRIVPVHTNVKWKQIEFLIKNKYKRFKNPELAYGLELLLWQDQLNRSLNNHLLALTGFIPMLDSNTLDYIIQIEDNFIKTDTINLRQMLSLIGNGIPSVHDVGEMACKAIVYILLHNENEKTLVKFLPEFFELCSKGEFDWRLYTLLYDKLCVIHKTPQKYGTQYVYDTLDKNSIRLYKISNLSEVNVNRGMVGLPVMIDEHLYEKIKVK